MELVGQRVKRLRDRRVWTQEQLAEKSGVPVVTISRLETGWGSITPRQSTVVKLAEALDVTPTYLMFGEDDLDTKIAA